MFDKFKQPSDELVKLLRATASENEMVRAKAVSNFLTVLGVPIRSAIFDASNHDNIFTLTTLAPGESPVIPIDPFVPGTEDQYTAYVASADGCIPRHVVTGGEVYLDHIDVRNAMAWPLKYAKHARWDVVARYMEVMLSSFVKKRNDNCWHTLLTASADRGLTVYDNAANAGQVTRRLFTLAECAVKRNGGGNATSTGGGRLTDVYMSCEGISGIRNWNVDQIDELTRREIYMMEDNPTTAFRISGINVHELYELGQGQEYQDYYLNTVGSSLVDNTVSGHDHDDVELAVGLDLLNRNSFVLMQMEPLELFEDKEAHKCKQGGAYGWEAYGVAALDNRRVVSLSF